MADEPTVRDWITSNIGTKMSPVAYLTDAINCLSLNRPNKFFMDQYRENGVQKSEKRQRGSEYEAGKAAN